jgi:hypothetical protein
MIGFNHTLAGAIIAVIIPAPFVPLVAFFSHFLLDMTPHFGRSKTFTPYTKEFKWLLIIDAILCFCSLFFAWWLFPEMWLIIAIGTFFSTLPDFLWLLRGKSKKFQWFFTFAEKIQWGERPWGWILELAYGVVFVTVLISLQP